MAMELAKLPQVQYRLFRETGISSQACQGTVSFLCPY